MFVARNALSDDFDYIWYAKSKFGLTIALSAPNFEVYQPQNAKEVIFWKIMKRNEFFYVCQRYHLAVLLFPFKIRFQSFRFGSSFCTWGSTYVIRIKFFISRGWRTESRWLESDSEGKEWYYRIESAEINLKNDSAC